MNVHEWPYPSRDTCFIGRGYHDHVFVHSDSIIGISTVGWHQISKQKWLARRAELQNKPSWDDAPEWANWLAQWNDGTWFWCDDEIDNPPQEGDSGWYQDGRTLHLPAGEVLGDWRDTLERRPVDLSEPAVTARLTKATDNVLAAVPELVKDTYKFEDYEDMIERIYWEFDSIRAKKLNPERDIFKRFVRSAMVHIGPAEKLIKLLTTSPDNFTASELMEIHQLVDSELNKRDAAVCGGEKNMGATWFERGELPPVGANVQWRPGSMGQWGHERWVDVDVIAHAGDGDIVIKWDGEAGNNKQLVTASQEAFRPIRTERDQAVDEMMKCTLGVMNQETQRRLFEDLYDAGYRKQNLPAK